MTDLFDRKDAAPAPPSSPQNLKQDSNKRGDGQNACMVCGALAYFGFGVKLLAGRPGRWSCGAHRDAVKNAIRR
ncbi:hypothetical protein RZS28_19845 (plasmid) [Methylocapsa polymorpha]|uniref:Uncharacterized protein n=1 Tax=Methylocapsa polymorpha TaxID=3080828 RepID=A0ABZ0HXW9_9HYPH|nr:hypothetical protein [Methylocapsa sp. RX1]WOJ91700.1 hypothetical protein RZS28_19845 [Methylocapsa sp. RX1]